MTRLTGEDRDSLVVLDDAGMPFLWALVAFLVVASLLLATVLL